MQHKKTTMTPRYETEPDLSGGETPAEVQEQVEIRPDLAEAQAEKGESAPVDTAYAGEVSRFFNEKRRIAELTGAEDTELFDYGKFAAMQQMSLEKLANPKTAKEMLPRDAAMALGDLAGTMASRNLEIGGNRTGDAAADRETESEHAAAKKVFMASCEKLYPHVTVDKNDFGNDLRRTVDALVQAADAPSLPELDGAELEKMAENNPKELARKLDEILYKTGDSLQAGSRISFDLEDPQRRREASGQMAVGTELFYKLQLMRDELQERMYGRKDVLPSEATKIDEMRAAFGGEAASAERMPEKAEGAELTENEQATLRDVEGAVTEERALSKQAEKEGGALVQEVVPANEAFRTVWKKDRPFSGRLTLLSERIENMAQLKLQSGPNVEPGFAYRLSMRQIFGELLPAETAALKEAARRESERRHQLAEKTGDKNLEKPVSAERLFIELMGRLVKEKHPPE